MSFLPIVERELREAARRKSTFRIRGWVSGIGMGLSFLSLLWAQMARLGGSVGNPAFGMFTGYAFGLSLLAGVLLTADCISEEKREGTIGLLFLTDLKGYDVVLGKFAARSLNALYGLLALLPLAGVPILLGGVTGGEFWRMALALVNALFFSLSAGVLVSCVSRDSQRAMGGALGLVLLFAAGLPISAELALRLKLLSRWTPLAWVSPFYPYGYAMEPLYLFHRGTYWWSLLASHLQAWLLLAAGAWVLPHAWQEKGAGVKRAASAGWERWRGWGMSTAEKRAVRRATELEINPVFWLAGCNRAVSRSLWIIIGAWALFALATALASRPRGGSLPLILPGALVFSFVIKGLLAVQSCRFFSEARRSGLLELLLCTPLTGQNIIFGQSLAFQKVALAPLGVFVGLLFSPYLLLTGWNWMIGNGLSQAPVSEWVTSWGFGGSVTLCLLLDVLAIRWFGIWLSLKLKNPTYATGLTILLVVILPSAFCSVPPCCVFTLLTDLVCFLVGYINLQQDLRRLLARQYDLPPGAKPPTRAT